MHRAILLVITACGASRAPVNVPTNATDAVTPPHVSQDGLRGFEDAATRSGLRVGDTFQMLRARGASSCTHQLKDPDLATMVCLGEGDTIVFWIGTHPRTPADIAQARQHSARVTAGDLDAAEPLLIDRIEAGLY